MGRAMNPDLAQPGPRYQALLGVLRAAESLWQASRVFFAHWDLSASQFNILNLLRDAPDGLTQSELSRELITHRSNVKGLVDRLEKRGLVARKENAKDGRAWRVVLTAAGRRLVERVLPPYYAVAEEVWGDLPSARAKTLAGDLEQVSSRAGLLAVKSRRFEV